MKENIYILSFMPLLHRIPRLKVSSPSQQIAFVIPLGQVASMFPHFFSSQPPSFIPTKCSTLLIILFRFPLFPASSSPLIEYYRAAQNPNDDRNA